MDLLPEFSSQWNACGLRRRVIQIRSVDLLKRSKFLKASSGADQECLKCEAARPLMICQATFKSSSDSQMYTQSLKGERHA